MARTQREGRVAMHVRSPAAAAHTAVEMESETARRMAEAATTFFASLTIEQQGRAFFPLDPDLYHVTLLGTLRMNHRGDGEWKGTTFRSTSSS